MCFCQSGGVDTWDCGAPDCKAAVVAGRQKDNPWHPMSDAVDLKYLGKLSEECGELGAAIGRCIIQGIDGREPHTAKTNCTWLTEEISDVLINIGLCIAHFRLDEALILSRIKSKTERLRKWHEQA